MALYQRNDSRAASQSLCCYTTRPPRPPTPDLVAGDERGMNRPTYYAITTSNAQGGWRILAMHANPNVARRDAEAELLKHATDANGTLDIYAQTELRNLTIATASALLRGREGQRRVPRLSLATLRAMYERWQDEVEVEARYGN